MPPRFHRKRSVSKSIRRIAEAQIDAALAAIRDPDVADIAAVHIVRQRLKALRALIRLPGPAFGGFRDENIAFRDLARRLAHTRDADVLGKTFDGFAEKAQLAQSAELRHPLLSSIGEGMSSAERRALLQGEIAAGLVAARRRVKRWQFKRSGFGLIGPGLKRVYKAMQAAEAVAAEHPNAVHFHEWRKQAKYHADQLAVIEAVAPEIFEGYRAIATRLGDTLGKHHDLDVMAAALLRLDLSHDRRATLQRAIASRSAKLEAKAFRLGLELSAERPDDFVRRVETGWMNWRHPKRRLHALPPG